VAISTLPRRALFKVAPRVLRVLGPLERRIIRSFDPAAPVSPPPLFLVGSPRSGSTVAYQLITSAFEVDYPSNLAALFHHSLYLGMAAQRRAFGQGAHASLRSENGRTPGWRGPHQLAEFWYRWFPRDSHFVAGDYADAAHFAELRRTLGAIARRSGRPFVVKNLNNGQRLQAFRRVLPEALFVFCRRDPLETAASILSGRKRVLHDEEAWWGVEPANVAELRRLPYPEQVVRQVYHVEKQIEQDLRLFDDRQHMVLRLEDLRRDPAAVLDAVEALFARNGVAVRRRGGVPLPDIRGAGPTELTADEEQALRAEVERLDW